MSWTAFATIFLQQTETLAMKAIARAFLALSRMLLRSAEKDTARTERNLLGGLLLDPSRVPEVMHSGILGLDFQESAHQKIYSVFCECAFAEETWDVVTVKEVLFERDELCAIGGVAYLSGLIEGVSYPVDIIPLARKVKDAALARQELARAEELAKP